MTTDTSKKSNLSSNIFYLECDTETRMKLIEHGVITVEELEKAMTDFELFMAELEREWPPERVKEYVLTQKREKCKWCAARWEQLEIENKEAREKGVSFQDRKHFTTKIDTLKKMFADTRKEGIELSKKGLTARDFVSPLDVGYIQAEGFEKHLKYAII